MTTAFWVAVCVAGAHMVLVALLARENRKLGSSLTDMKIALQHAKAGADRARSQGYTEAAVKVMTYGEDDRADAERDIRQRELVLNEVAGLGLISEESYYEQLEELDETRAQVLKRGRDLEGLHWWLLGTSPL